MNWKPQIFKPKWQHKDAEVRREAVATEHDPELLAALGQICLEDEDPGVRVNAVKRLDDLEALALAKIREKDGAVTKIIMERLRHLAALATDTRAPLATRLKILADSDDRELIEAVAANAPEAELRAQAVTMISRQGFLGDRAIADPDPDIRRQAAAAITQQSTLRRVISGTRTTDKALHQALGDRLHWELLAAGDPEAVDREALGICEAVEQALIKQDVPNPALVEEFRNRWSKLTDLARPEHQRRFNNDLVRLAGEEEPEVSEESPPPVEEESAKEPEATVQAADPAPADALPSGVLSEALQVIRDHAGTPLSKLSMRRLKDLEKRWSAAWASIPEPNPAERLLGDEAGKLLERTRHKLETVAAKRDELFEKGQELVTLLTDELEQGELHKALETQLELQKLGKKLGKDSRWKAIRKQVNSMQGRLRELRGWQHWSNDKIRKRMIKEMEALPSAGLHPDAVLDRIKELQASWKELEQSEQIPGDKHFAAAPWMWRKFNMAGRKAFEATKPFLDKRTEIQKKHLESMRSLSNHITEIAASEAPDWTSLGKALGQARREMRSLGEVPARARHKMAGRLKAALEKGNQAMQSHYEVVEKKKLKLIREAAQLTHVADRDEAISTAKSLQADWKAAGSLWRSRENQLWQEFRQPLDPLFENLKAEQQNVREERNALLADQKGLCAELKAILKLDDNALAEQQGKVQGLRDSWGDFRHPDRRLQADFQKLVEKFQARLAAQAQRAENRTRECWWEKSELLHKAETARRDDSLDEKLRAKLEKAWPETAAPGELDELLDSRFKATIEGSDTPGEAVDPDTAVETARKQCICLEFLAGLPSPGKEKDLRMQYQVDRLSESLSGDRKRMSAVEEARMLETEWLALPLVPERNYKAFRKRVKAAIETIITDK